MYSTTLCVILSFFCSHKGRSSCTVMAVGNVQSGHCSKLIGYQFYVICLINNPKLMSKSINRRNKIIYWFRCRITHNKLVKARIVRVCKEYWLHVCIANTHMFHSVFFLILTGKLMLFNHTVNIILY